MFWKYAANLQENTHAEVLCNFIEIALQHGCFSTNLQHIFRTSFPKNTSGRLLLLTAIVSYPGWNKLYFASAQTFVYTKMFSVHDRAHKNCVLMPSSCTEAKISAKTPLCQAVYKIQIATNPQCLMSAIATFNSLFLKVTPCKSVQYLVPISKLDPSCWENSLHAFLFWSGRAVLGSSVKYPRCRYRKKIIHRELLQPRFQVLFTVEIA